MITLRLKALICSPNGNFPVGSLYNCEEIEAKQLLDGGYAELVKIQTSIKEEAVKEQKNKIETTQKTDEVETTDEVFEQLENTSIEIKKKRGRPAKSED